MKNMEQQNVVRLPDSDRLMEMKRIEAFSFMNTERLGLMKTMADTFIASGALPPTIKNTAQLIMIMQAGYEAGLQPMAAIRSFYFVNGRLSMYGDVAIARVRAAGHKITWGQCNETTATVTIVRGDTEESMTETFTMAMAVKRGLTNKGGPWISAPDNMLKFKAFWAVARFLVPDAFSRDGAPIDIGEIVEAEIVTENQQPTPTENQKTTSLSDALESKNEPKKRSLRNYKIQAPKEKPSDDAKQLEQLEQPESEKPVVEEKSDVDQFDANVKRYRELRERLDNGEALDEHEHDFLKRYVNGEI